MGYSAGEIIPRFVKHAGQPDGYEPDGKPWKVKPGRRLRQRFWYAADFSYGYDGPWDSPGRRVTEIRSHRNPLGRLVLTPSGRRRLWVLNGDRWSGGWGGGATAVNDHRDMLREAVQRSGDRWYVIPFSAAGEAGIVLDSIVPVAVDEEHYTTEEHTAATLEQVPEGYRKRRVYRDQDGRELTVPRTADGSCGWPDYKGGWYLQRHSMLDGASREAVDGPAYERITDSYEGIQPDSSGVYRWSEQRHWLGESVIRARVSYHDRERDVTVRGERWFLSAFDSNEPWPLWFLAQLPAGAKPRSVAAAREALKPPRVRVAELMGREILRQGDVFAIRTDFATRELRGARTERSAYVLGVNHVATEVRVIDGVTYARGFLRHRPQEWGRRPEHVTLQLGDRATWFELVRNTVPSRRAWALGGNVD